MTRFIASVEFEFEADDIRGRARRLRELGAAASSIGLEMLRSEIRPGAARPKHGPTAYGPKVDPTIEERSQQAGSFSGPELDEHGEGSQLRGVLPIAHRFSDGIWAVSAEVWDNGIVVRWASDEGPGPLLLAPDWVISDDLGTEYARAGGGASRSGRALRGHVEFTPAPPTAVISLQIRGTTADELISVPLPG